MYFLVRCFTMSLEFLFTFNHQLKTQPTLKSVLSYTFSEFFFDHFIVEKRHMQKVQKCTERTVALYLRAPPLLDSYLCWPKHWWITRSVEQGCDFGQLSFHLIKLVRKNLPIGTEWAHGQGQSEPKHARFITGLTTMGALFSVLSDQSDDTVRVILTVSIY